MTDKLFVSRWTDILCWRRRRSASSPPTSGRRSRSARTRSWCWSTVSWPTWTPTTRTSSDSLSKSNSQFSANLWQLQSQLNINKPYCSEMTTCQLGKHQPELHTFMITFCFETNKYESFVFCHFSSNKKIIGLDNQISGSTDLKSHFQDSCRSHDFLIMIGCLYNTSIPLTVDFVLTMTSVQNGLEMTIFRFSLST